MTEAEWLVTEAQEEMWRFVCRRMSRRQQVLYACACCRRIWHLITDPRSRAGVDAAERWADGLIDDRQMWQPRSDAFKAWEEKYNRWNAYATDATAATADATWAAAATTTVATWAAVAAAATAADAANAAAAGWLEKSNGERATQCGLLRDIAGNPFRPIQVDSAWRTRTVLAVAQAAYQDVALPDGHLDCARLAILADALEDAGCIDADILSHLRGPGPHVRGCWVLDCLLVHPRNLV